MRGLVVGPKLVALEVVQTAAVDLHVPVAGEDGREVPLDEVELIVMVVVVVAAVVR
jgi:hypothetical protein